jgi:hypothetical protein
MKPVDARTSTRRRTWLLPLIVLLFFVAWSMLGKGEEREALPIDPGGNGDSDVASASDLRVVVSDAAPERTAVEVRGTLLVVDAQTGEGLAGAELELAGERRRAGDDGRIVLDGLVAGLDVLAVVTCDGHLPTEVDLAERPERVALDPWVQVHGVIRFRDEERSLPVDRMRLACVTRVDDRRRIDEIEIARDLSFSFTPTDRREMVLYLSRWSFAGRDTIAEVTWRYPQERVVIDADAEPDGQIPIEVVVTYGPEFARAWREATSERDPEDRYASLQCEGGSWRGASWGRPELDGSSATFPFALPPGLWRFVLQTRTGWNAHWSDVEVTPDTRRVELTVPEVGRVRVALTDSVQGGSERPWGTVEFLDLDGRALARLPVPGDAGVAEKSGVPEGEYTLVGRRRGGRRGATLGDRVSRPHRLVVRPHEVSLVTLPLLRTGLLRVEARAPCGAVRMTTADGAAVGSVHVGYRTIESLPPGDYVLHYWGVDRFHTAEARVVEGETTVVQLEEAR